MPQLATICYIDNGEAFLMLHRNKKPNDVHEGKWIGVKVGTFCTRPAITTNDGGWSDVDWFRITKK